jgi:hypothetical protein
VQGPRTSTALWCAVLRRTVFLPADWIWFAGGVIPVNFPGEDCTPLGALDGMAGGASVAMSLALLSAVLFAVIGLL